MIPTLGQTIRLVEMPDDPAPIAPGSRGVVTGVYPMPGDEVQIAVDWESGRRLMLVHPVDKFVIED